MDKKTQIVLRKISQYCIYMSLLLVPILFLPFTSDYFEFNKSTLFIVLTFIGLTTWTFSLDPTEEISVWKSEFDKPVIILSITALFSTILSKNVLTSILGFSATLSNSFVFFLTLLAFSFLVKNVLISKKSIDKAIIFISISGTIISILSIIQYWGIFIFKFLDPLQFTTYRRFTPLGYENPLPFFLLLLIPFGIYIYDLCKKNKKSKIYAISSFFLLIYSIILTSGKIWTWPAFFIIPATILLSLITKKVLNIKLNPDKKIFIPLMIGVFVLLLVHNIPSVENKLVTTKSFYSAQPDLSLDTSWKVLTNQYSDSAKEIFFGAGPDTYAYTFSKYKPASYSNSENSGIRFAKSSTQVLETASNYGIVGLAAWIFLFTTSLKIIKKIFKTKKESQYESILKLFSIILISTLLMGVFVFYTSIFWIFIWMSIGIISTTYILHFPKEAKRFALSFSLTKGMATPQRQNVLPLLFKVVSILILVTTLFFTTKLYIGEIYYLLGKNVGTSDAENDEEIIKKYIQANNYFSDAIKFFPQRDDYFSDRSIVETKLLEKSVDLLIKEEGKGSFTSEQTQLTSLSLDSLRSALTLNPSNVRNFKSAVYVYEALMNITEGNYATELLGSINSGLELDPNDPELHHKKGVVLFLAKRDGAEDEIERAIELDPLYLQAYLDLAVINHSNGNFKSAQENLEKIVKIMDEYDLQDLEIYEQITRNIENYKQGYVPENLEFESIETVPDDIEEKPEATE